MRLDKFLQLSRLIKRRVVAKEVCQGGRVQINGRVAKPGSEVHPGDRVALNWGSRSLVIEVLSLPRSRAPAEEVYRVVEEHQQDLPS